jgi:hypothetical protein
MVRVPGSTALEDVEDAVTHLLAPYQENNMGDCPEEYMEFNDKEPEIQQEYEEESMTRIRMADGTLLSPYEPQFKVDPPADAPPFTRHTWKYPDDAEEVEVPNKELFDSWEAFAVEYGEYERDEQTGKFGYWHNPNCKWDWWVIGGRWSGYFPVPEVRKELIGSSGAFGNAPRENCVDVTRISDIDNDAIAVSTRERIAEFWVNYDQFIADLGKERRGGHPFGGPRSDLLSVGLIQCKNADELTSDDREFIVNPWETRPHNPLPQKRYDVINNTLTTPEARAAFQPVLEAQFNRLRPYSYMDAAGWYEPGEMGWFGMSSESPESMKEYADDFTDWVKGGDQSDWLVLVDCHI